MKRTMTVNIIYLGLILAGGAAQAAPPCPTSNSQAALNSYRDALAGVGASEAKTSLESCFPTNVPACLSRIDGYSHNQGSVNFTGNDDAKDEQRQIPKELLERGHMGASYVIASDVEERAKRLGWPVARYKSRHSGGFDPSTPSLIMIEVPGSMLNPPVSYDRFINIAIKQDDDEDGTNPTPKENFRPIGLHLFNADNYPHIATLVTVQHADRDHKAHLYYQMFDRTGNRYSARAPSNPIESGCLSCHPSGLRAISPLGYHVRAGEKQLAPDNWAQVKRLNSDMAAGQRGGISWGVAANGRDYDTRFNGPVVGPSAPLSENTRTKEFIVGADGNSGCANSRQTVNVTDIFGRAPGRNNTYTFTSSPPVDWQKVSDAMDCEMCHNGERQGVINGQTSWAEVDFKILVDQSMPFGVHKNPLDQGTDPNTPVVDDLNPNERLALANCLRAEYNQEQSKLHEWMTALSCGDAGAKNIKRGEWSRLPAAKKKVKKPKTVSKKKKPSSPKKAASGEKATE